MKPDPTKHPVRPVVRPPMVVRESAPSLLAQHVAELRERGVEVVAWTVRAGEIR